MADTYTWVMFPGEDNILVYRYHFLDKFDEYKFTGGKGPDRFKNVKDNGEYTMIQVVSTGVLKSTWADLSLWAWCSEMKKLSGEFHRFLTPPRAIVRVGGK